MRGVSSMVGSATWVGISVAFSEAAFLRSEES